LSTILHLSDLHLGDPDAWERKTDDKVGLVPAMENSRLAVVETTLRTVKAHLAAEGRQIDALVVSGDLTSRNDPKGFERFRDLLKKVDLAPADSTVVVPGNHDVDWSCDPGTKQKYERFLNVTRQENMRTPLCDGVDGDDYASAAHPAEPVLWLPDAVIASVNTANWCGVRFDQPQKAHRRMGRLRRKPPTYDVARVSETQLDRLTDALKARPLDHRVRIAVLHHHLLPVTEDEEVKPFESFTNLARLRGWLRDHGFQVVLHGHKHRSTLTWDHIYDFEAHSRAPQRVAIVSAPAPTTWGADVCRLIRIGDSTDRQAVDHAPRIVVDTVRAERPERPINLESVHVALDAPVPATAGYLAIEAETSDAVYEQLVDALDARGGALFNVTCVVRDAASALIPPTNFKEVDDPERWLKDAVAWWQKPAPALVASGDAPFNHGERLYSTGNRQGSLDIAARKLGSTKAIALLLREAELRAGSEAPAFVAVQLVKVTDESGARLDCVGYFRKQDLTLWWPVNIRELRAIQMYVLDLATSKGLRAGRLVTIAAEAIRDNVLPELAGTTVDRSVDLRPDELMLMAYRAAHGRAEEVDDIRAMWTRVLRDIGDGRDFPSLGIARLIEHLEVFRTAGGLTDLDVLIKRLQAVYDRAHRAKREARRETERDEFSEQLFKQVTEVLDAVGEAVRDRGVNPCPNDV
jgi:predicted phosphodiesterase